MENGKVSVQEAWRKATGRQPKDPNLDSSQFISSISGSKWDRGRAKSADEVVKKRDEGEQHSSGEV